MKITKVDTLCLSRMHELERQWITSKQRIVKADCAIVRIHTDTGLIGIGEASAYGGPLMIRDWVNWLAPDLVDKDPWDPDICMRPNGRPGSWSYNSAVAGIDCALWDLRGKIEGLRVSELLTENPLDRVRLYASSGCRYDWRYNPEQLIEEALEYIQQGFTAMKFRIGTYWGWDGVTVDRFLGLVRELTQAVDGRMELMLDGNARLTEDQAMEIALALDQLGFVWFEEPTTRDPDVYAKMSRAMDNMLITAGEVLSSLDQFRPWFDRQAIGIAQPDAAYSGITEAMRIARMAHRYGIGTCPHSWHNGLMAAEHAHYVAALPSDAARPYPRVLELCMIQGPLQWAVLDEKPVIENGYLILPDKPGFGVTLAEDLEARFPYIEGQYAIPVNRDIEH